MLSSFQREKIDASDDSMFYEKPRFVYHLDINFRRYLTKLYERELAEKSTILDLMSSWDSYLPNQKTYKKIIGHGLNKQELEKNEALETFWTQNLNSNQKLPLENESIDYCLMVAAWQYLQFPENITKEVFRILSQNGKILISFSNRAFWTKAPNIWTHSSEEERIDYIIKILNEYEFSKIRVIREFTSQNKFLPFFNNDPFYCVIGEKSF